MVLNTRRLFVDLLPVLDARTVCDVGSMNGADALRFRGALPDARILAFEPNPGNLERMRADSRLAAARIEIVPVAVADFDGEAPFFLVKTDYQAEHDRRGMSSLHERADTALRDSIVTTPVTRLDTALRGSGAPGRIALWIDVEGKTYEAIEGASGLFADVCLLHVEVETRPCIGERQRLYPEVNRLLEAAGFVELATDRPANTEQFNALFIRREIATSHRRRISWPVGRQRLRRAVVDVVRAVWPQCVRRLTRLLGRT